MRCFPEMLFHYIRPVDDQDLQSNRMDLKEVMEKHQALLCVLKDPEGFEAACAAFEFDEMKPDEELPIFCRPACRSKASASRRPCV